MAEVKLDAPHDLIRWFTLQGTKVHWIDRETAITRGFRGNSLRKLKPENSGRPAGSRQVHGRGMIVHCSSRRFLTVDIRDAINSGFEWPWDIGAFSHDPDSLVAGADALVSSTWLLDGASLFWKENVHDDLKAGDPVAGALLSGPRGRFVSTKGVSFLMQDVIHYLHEGKWPWADGKAAPLAPVALPDLDMEPPEFVNFEQRIAAFKARPRDIEWD